MKTTIRGKALTIGALLCAVVVLVVGMALPVSADAPTTPAAIQTVQGKVTGVNPSSSFIIQNGNQTPITIAVDQSTLYFTVPQGKSLNSQGNNDTKDNNGDDKNGNHNNNKQVLPGNIRGMSIPSNWRSDLGWLSIFDVTTNFSSIQVGDTIIVRMQTSGNLAKQVLIIKAPAIQQVNGNITAINGNTITITPTTGSAVTVNWNADTQLTIKGQIALQVGQKAVVVYNRTSMIAQTIRAQITAPIVPAALSVTINQAAGQSDPNKNSPINFTVVFSGSVTDFATGDVTLSGTAGATTATVTGSGTTYNVAVNGMTTTGTVIASIAAGVAHDAATNPNAASTSTDNIVTYDITAPTVTINQASGQADPTNTSPINFTVVFSESVADFATGDVTLSGAAGATTATVTGSGTTYNVAVSGMTTTGTVIASIAAGVAHDAATNPNAASTSTDNTVTRN